MVRQPAPVPKSLALIFATGKAGPQGFLRNNSFFVHKIRR